MVEPFAGPSDMAMVTQLIRPRQHLCARRCLRAWCRGYGKFYNPAQKIIYLVNTSILSLFLSPPMIALKFPGALPLIATPLISSLSHPSVFGWLLCDRLSSQLEHFSTVLLHFIFFSVQMYCTLSTVLSIILMKFTLVYKKWYFPP